ncbi:MAG TPA: ABC transporter permease [Herpetosiphonaceae bacterium]
MSANLWRAEWLKTRKRPANIGMIIVMLAVLAMAVLAFTGLALWNGDPDMNHLENARSVLPFPGGALLAANVLAGFSALLAIVFVANTVGSEYSRDTWKMIIPRQGNRLSFLLTKYLLGVVVIVAATFALMAITQVLAWLGALVLGIDLVSADIGGMLSTQGSEISAMLADMLFFSTFALLVTVASRSTVSGIVIGFIGMVLMKAIPGLSRYLALTLPTVHIDNVLGHWANMPTRVMGAEAAFHRVISPWSSLAVVLGYMALFIGVSCLLFKRRDMAGG